MTRGAARDERRRRRNRLRRQRRERQQEDDWADHGAPVRNHRVLHVARVAAMTSPREPRRQFNGLMLMLRNCTRLGGPFHLPSRLPPWCCSPIGPLAGRPGSWAFSITVLPFSIDGQAVALHVISKVFHSPTGLSACVFGVTPARTSGGIFASMR